MKKLLTLFFILAMVMAGQVHAEESVFAREVYGFADTGTNQYIDHLAMSMNGTHLCNSVGLAKRFATQKGFDEYIAAYPDSGLVWEGQVENWYGISCFTPPITAKKLYTAKFKIELVDYQGQLASRPEGSKVYLPLPQAPASTMFFAE